MTSEGESFLTRWSRRKQAAAARDGVLSPDESAPTQEKEKDATKSDTAAASIPGPACGAPTRAEAADKTAMADLPSLDAITADTDIRGFLRPGVPEDLRRAALRRAWSADPAIRDFVGPVENGWDFNDPHAMPGFGPMAEQDIARLITQVVGAPPSADAATQTGETGPAAPPHARTADDSDSSMSSSSMSSSMSLGRAAAVADDGSPREPTAIAVQQDPDAAVGRRKDAEG